MECRKVVITRLRNTEYYRGEPLNHIVDSIYQLLVNYIETSDKGYPVKNPNIVEEIDERTPTEIMSEIEELDKQSTTVLKKIKDLL